MCFSDKEWSESFKTAFSCHNQDSSDKFSKNHCIQQAKPEIRRTYQYNSLRDRVPKPTSARKSKNRYGVKSGY